MGWIKSIDLDFFSSKKPILRTQSARGSGVGKQVIKRLAWVITKASHSCGVPDKGAHEFDWIHIYDALQKGSSEYFGVSAGWLPAKKNDTFGLFPLVNMASKN